MNKKTLLILNIAAICIISTLLFSFKSTTTTYQYMTITTFFPKMDQVYITVDDKEYIRVPDKKYYKNSKGDWDQTGLIALVHEYEAKGWVLQNMNYDNGNYFYWLKKEN